MRVVGWGEILGRGDGAKPVECGNIGQGRAFQFQHVAVLGVEGEHRGNETVFVLFDESLGAFRPLDRREQPLPRLVPERFDPACGRSGLSVVAGIEALVLIVDDQRRLAPPPLVEHTFRARRGEVPCVEVSSRERAGPAVARSERTVGQKPDLRERPAERIRHRGQQKGM